MTVFVPQAYEDILADVIALAAEITDRSTDFNPGSILRALCEAAAVGIERAEVGFAIAVERGVKESAFTLWRFSRSAATRSYGILRLYASSPASDIPIPRGSRFGVPGTTLYYVNEQNETFPSGETEHDILVVCHETGQIGNVAANTVTQVISALPGITGCTNPEAYFTGTDEEGDDERESRFIEHIRRLPRGTLEALELGAQMAALTDASGYTTEQVVSAQAVEGVGTVDVYIWNGVSGASTSLIDECELVLVGRTLPNGDRVSGYKAAGVTVSVAAASTLETTVKVEVTLQTGFDLDDLRTAIVAAIEEVFQKLDIGETFYIMSLVCAVRSVAGVVDAKVQLPTDDVEAGTGEIVTLSGTPVIVEAE